MKVERITLDDKMRAKFEEAGITVRSLTQEECDRFPISMHGGPRSMKSKPDMQAPEEMLNPDYNKYDEDNQDDPL